MVPKVASTYLSSVTPRGSWLHWHAPNQTWAQLSFYSIRVQRIRHVWQI